MTRKEDAGADGEPGTALAGRAAHEIGTALTAISVALDRLERDHLRPAPPPRELAIVREQAERLARLARQLLVLATPAAAESVRLDVNEEAGHLVALFRTSAERAGVELRFRPAPGGPTAVGDPRLLREVILALLENACRAAAGSSAGPWVEVSVRQRPGGGADVRVLDSGPGVAHGREEAIFLPFVSSWGRAGLGLTLSRLSARGQGGTLRVERDAGDRATFVLSLEPAAEENGIDAGTP